MNKLTFTLCLTLFGAMLYAQPIVTPAQALEPAYQQGLRYKTNPAQLDDRTFLRRVWLDLTGQLPSPSMAEAFLADPDPGKHSAEIDRLINSSAFTERWTTFFADIYQNHAILQLRGYWRNAFHDQLRTMIAENQPVDEMARSILTAQGKAIQPEAAMFFWAREALEEDYRLDYLDDQIAWVTDTMLGVQTLCISCHDGANHLEEVNVDLSVRHREDFWGMAAFVAPTYFYLDPEDFADYPQDDAEAQQDYVLQNLRVVDRDEPGFEPNMDTLFPILDSPRTEANFRDGEYLAESTVGQGMRPPRQGGIIEPVYMFTGEKPRAGETRRQALARMITADRQFARNIVNRVWAHFFGRGFVEPLNGWDLARINQVTADANNTSVQPRNPELMAYLTDWFIQHDYDLRALVRIIANSQLYLWDYADTPFGEGAAFDGDPWAHWRDNSRLRRIDAESLVDSLFSTLGIQPQFHVLGEGQQTYASAWQMPDPAEPSILALVDLYFDGDQLKPGVSRESIDYLYFFQHITQTLQRDFGRGDYFNGVARTNEDTIQNALTLMNDPFSHYYLQAPQVFPNVQQWTTALANGQMTKSDLVTTLYNVLLFREPSPAERQILMDHIANITPAEAVTDSLWILLNHPDFLYR